MENSNLFVPFQDPSDSTFNIIPPFNDQFFLHDENTSLGLPELPSIPEPSLCNWFPSDQPGFGVDNNNMIPNDSEADQFALYMINENAVVGHCDAGVSGVNGENDGLENANVSNQTLPDSSCFGSPMQLQDSPDLSPPYILLREICHTNGKQVRNLEIYGLIGVINHAIVYKVDPDNPSENVDYQIFNFSGESLSNVNNFFVQYWEERKQEGYWMTQDPFFHFYQALCVGINANDNLASNNSLQPLMISDANCNNAVGMTGRDNGHIPMNQQEGGDKNGTRRPKINLSKQRERTGKLKLQDFSNYFDLPITDVAEKLNVCASVVKKKCREAGLKRWPYRKIKGIKRKLKQKKESLTACTDEERPRTLLEIQTLELQLQDIFTKLGQLQM